MSTQRITLSDREALEEQIRGTVLLPHDGDYDESRAIWNGAVEKFPAVIVRSAGPADVVTTVEFARKNDVPLSVKAGGHMTTGHAICEDGVVLDLSAMDAVRVDPHEQIARVEGGATWDQVNHEALQFGLVPPGSPMSVGVAGFTLGGGQGVVTRLHGLASDNLREVDVVTADGTLVTASEDENEDLFWAVRGGGGNFGIVTSFEFDLFDLPTEVMTAQVMYGHDSAAEFLQLLRTELPAAPEPLLPMVSLVRIPSVPDFPAALHGEPAIFAYLTFVGESDAARAAFEPFLSLDDALLEVTAKVPFGEVWADFQVPKGKRHHWECAFVDALSDELIETLVAAGTSLPNDASAVTVYGFGDALTRFEPSAYAHREAPYLVHVATQWSDASEDDAMSNWTRERHTEIAAYGTGGEYINNQTDDDEERVRAAFGDNYDRLVEIKRRWDPENLFQVNQNIDPGG